jgi:LysR family transcriptional regulator, benzoate and cis,cis-muconate-responsive activator of ben and cat genes
MSDDFRVELRHLRYFIAVAKHGSFNRAAQSLHLTQPALSRQVRDLEEELATPLLVRGTNAVTLTQAGKVFYEEALEVIGRAELAVQRVRDERRTEVLRIGYAPSVTSGILPRALERFRAEQPRVRVELADLFPEEMSRRAANGELDIVITLEGPGASTPNFQWEELRRLRLVLVMPAKHELTRLKRIPPQRLRGVALVGLDEESFPEYAPHIRKILKPFGVRPRFIAFERDGVSTVFTTLEGYNAATIVADSAVDFMPRSLVCRPFFPAFDAVIAKVGWTSTRSAHATLFVNFLRKEAQRVSRGKRILPSLSARR